MEKQEKNEIKRKHTLSLTDKISVTGVENVLTMGEKIIDIKLSDRFLTLTGYGFTPIHLDIDQGNLILSGTVLSLKYSSGKEKESFIKKIFK